MAKVDPLAALRSDHKQVRDVLLDLINATGKRNATRALEILIRLDKLTGPHFRFEEESFYPALQRFFGKEYYEYLLGVHDRIIRAGRELAAVLGTGQITAAQAEKLPNVIRTQVLTHPVECEGLGLFAERLPKRELDKIAANLEQCRKANVPLLEWADKIRQRKA